MYIIYFDATPKHDDNNITASTSNGMNTNDDIATTLVRLGPPKKGGSKPAAHHFPQFLLL